MPHGIDHLVVAVHDLDRAADLYRRMGFTVGARNRHPWGTLNHIVQFPGHFIELIAIEPGFVRPQPQLAVAQFAGFLADYLAKREGLAMLVLESRDAAADHAHFKASGIGRDTTFFFERRGQRPDGSEVRVAFTLAFAHAPAIPQAGFFVCQHHHPENFWSPSLQEHANGVDAVDAVVMAAPDPPALLPFLTAFAGGTEADAIAGGMAIDTSRGHIEIVRPDRLQHAYGEGVLDQAPATPLFMAIRFQMSELAALRAQLDLGGVGFTQHEGRIVVAPATAFGVALVFEAAT